ncbi:hypothetical protein DL1_00395 [Thioclava dalianensis]|uniref:N-acetyltransferase domain-containing protein n=1 Tax=Thioclava dalianensis TaxID=1185766 RepID=A0A074TS86_9RHOB|nr:hypothetical protein [Thioclava dalianensis]KEP71763.1 hypothetical protein DL1_00395 [Thioclava dalianensis]
MASETLSFSPHPWGPLVESYLCQIESAPRHLDVWRDQVASGEAQALLICDGSEPVGVMIWSVEREPCGAVIVANAVAGRARGHDLTAACIAFMKSTGRAVGAVALRCWTDRKGLVRKCERHGMRASYVIEGGL